VAHGALFGAVPPLSIVVVQDSTTGFRNSRDSAVRGTLRTGASVGERLDRRQIRIRGAGVALIAAATRGRAGRDGASGVRSPRAIPASSVVPERDKTVALSPLVHWLLGDFPVTFPVFR